MSNNETNLLKYVQTVISNIVLGYVYFLINYLLISVQNSNESKMFWKCLSILSKDEMKKLLVHYFIKVVDLKESGRENDELISKLDVSEFISLNPHKVKQFSFSFLSTINT